MKGGVATLKALLDEGGVKYRQNSQSFILPCPRCRKRDKLYIRKSDGRFVCWICRDTEGFSGAPEWVLTELLSRPVSELRPLLYGTEETPAELFLDAQLLDFMEEGSPEAGFLVPDLPEVLPDPGFRDLDSQAGARGREYLESRGIPLDVALEYGIKYHASESRVIFPVVSRGRLLGWQARYIGETSFYDEEADLPITIPKVLTTPGLRKDLTLMFGDRIRGDHVVLTEGPVDAIKAHLCGSNVAAMGKGVSRVQLQLLKNSGVKKLYLGLDPDAFVESQKILHTMVDDIMVYDLRPPAQFSDLGKMSMAQVRELFDKAPRIDRNYLFLYLKDHYKYASE